MANVDFTLKDIRELIKSDTPSLAEIRSLIQTEAPSLEDIRGLIHSETPSLIKKALIEERIHTQKMFDESHQATGQLIGTVLEQIDELHDEVAGIKRLVRKHSADIMSLQAARPA